MYYFDKWIEKKYFKQHNNLALYDQLTGLYNYNWFDKIGKNKYATRDVWITVIDLNNFKSINDIHGHLYGNQIIKDIGEQLLRVKDIDNESDTMRYGGDEFVIFSSINIAELIDKENHDKLFSYGSYFKPKFETLTSAFTKADDLMYDHKKSIKKST